MSEIDWNGLSSLGMSYPFCLEVEDVSKSAAVVTVHFGSALGMAQCYREALCRRGMDSLTAGGRWISSLLVIKLAEMAMEAYIWF